MFSLLITALSLSRLARDAGGVLRPAQADARVYTAYSTGPEVE